MKKFENHRWEKPNLFGNDFKYKMSMYVTKTKSGGKGERLQIHFKLLYFYSFRIITYKIAVISKLLVYLIVVVFNKYCTGEH